MKNSKLFIQKIAVPMLASIPWFAKIVEFSSNKFPRHWTLSVWSISPVRFDQVSIPPLTPSRSFIPCFLSSVPDKVSITLRVAMQFRFYNAALVCVHDACNRLIWIVAESYERGIPSLSNVDRLVLLAQSVEKISINLSSTVAFSINLWFVFYQNTWEIEAKIVSITRGRIYNCWKRDSFMSTDSW